MSQLKVTGGKPLCGRVTVSGTKNAALPILFATVLVNGVSTLRNLPDIRDVGTVLSLLDSMGAKVLRGDGWVQIDTTALSPLPYDPRTAELRGSLYLLGSSISRFGEVTFGASGGCDFGGRPYDYHTCLLEKMGCKITRHGDRITLKAEMLQGCKILLPYPSVGATCNAILAAMGASGETVIEGAAREPHVSELCDFLSACGAQIAREGSRLRLSTGKLHGADFTLSGDAIEAGTYLAAVRGTGGEGEVLGFDPRHLGEALPAFRAMGARVVCGKSGVWIKSLAPLRGISLKTAPFPGFPTDLHPVFAVLLSLSEGGGEIREEVFCQRFRYLEELGQMGVRVHTEVSRAIFRGGDILRAASVTVPDLRGGAALLTAALCAEGESVIHGAEVLPRGYADLPKKLCALGAAVQ